MRLAILSDIHANLPALEAVLADIERAGVDELWCLGDVVGYGAQPDECAALVAERCDALPGRQPRPGGARRARRLDPSRPPRPPAVRWTAGDGQARRRSSSCAACEPADESREVALYHASPRDPVWEYVLWPDQAAECIEVQAARVSLIGHSHVALFFVVPENGDRGRRPAQAVGAGPARAPRPAAGTRLDLAEGRWLVNPGSVGQPRDGDPRAAWLELDTDAWAATYHRVDYEIDRAAEAITATDLPEHLAQRLYVGQ